MTPATEVHVSIKDGRGHHVVFGWAVLALLLTAVSAAVVGMSPAAPAQAAPGGPTALGLGERTVEIDPADAVAVDKVADLEEAGSPVASTVGETARRKAAYIAPPSPPRTSRSTSSRSSSSSSGSGWQTARVSWYGPGFYGNTMAGGGTLQPNSMVVAHRSLAFGTRVQFQYNGRTCTAVVMDRGPYVGGRTFDLGPGTAKALGFGGVGTVKYRILGR
jgi:rare lipoprotein A (peptidoglycan hydrolase)